MAAASHSSRTTRRGSRHCVRALDAVEPRRLAETEDAAHPFWSLDRRSIGFFAEGKLKRVDLAGGAVQTVAQPAFRAGGSWEGDVILFVASPAEGISRVSASGGVPAAVTPDRKLTAVRVTTADGLSFGPPVTLFQTWLPAWGAGSTGWRTTYTVSSDGQRFLLVDRPERQPPITVVLNWTAALK